MIGANACGGGFERLAQFCIKTVIGGLAGRIVDLVSSGQTLKDNGLVETGHIMDITARLIVNRAALKTDPRVAALVEAFRTDSEERSAA